MVLFKKFLTWSLFHSIGLFYFPVQAQFTLLPAKQTGVAFVNKLTETEDNNVLDYEYFYNGGGVAVGDLNNDGLPDLYFTGNMVPDRVYLNQGKLQFKDITAQAGISKGKGWKTGVSLVDINQDGWLDIYVCYSGNGEAETRKNRLYINNKNLTFTEKAAQYGLDSPAYTTQAFFFDFDKDGDLDCYLLNHNVRDFKRFDAALVKAMRDPFAGDYLLRNDNGHFVDVSAATGIKSNPIGFGLGAAVSDLNQDGWPDLYVSNDYIEQDYLYIHQGNRPDGGLTFADQLGQSVGHLSYFSMGNAIADINNDGLPDILTLDMLPEDNKRQKLLYGPENYETYENSLKNGFYHQLMRNMLQLNNGDGTFSEIGQQLGISNTDWSWAPLIADFDNDGWKDLFITNGYLRDYTNLDFIKFYADQKLKAAKGSPTAMMDILKEMPSTTTHNYIFRNTGQLKFENKVKDWGFSQPMLANGAVYADLDGDGDLEIITNTINAPAAIYRNDGRSSGSHSLRVQLGKDHPALAVGAQVWLYTQGTVQYHDFYPARGYQSCMYTPLHFGIGQARQVDSLRVVWPNNQYQVLYGVAVDQTLVLDPRQAQQTYTWKPSKAAQPFFSPLTASDTLPYAHVEDEYNDFKRQLLLPNMLSFQGPHLAQADVNGDGLTDLYAPGAKGKAGALLVQQKDGTWQPSPQPAFEKDFFHEDTDALFFDADQDGDQDLYVVSGGYAYLETDILLQDRLYLNDGRGNFSRGTDHLPGERTSDACVTAFDVDHDGDPDLFVGGRVKPGRYPEPVDSRILLNDGKGMFTDGTDQYAPFLKNFGMVTDAATLDVNQDGWDDLLVVGEWMPVMVLLNQRGTLRVADSQVLGADKNGWWNRIAVEDLDNDGDADVVIGNFGWNCQMKPTEQEPVTMVYGDFDENGATDPFLCYYIQGKSYPFASRDEALNQLFSLRRKFTSYRSYAEASLAQILTPEQLKLADTLQAVTFTSVVLENRGDGTFAWHDLPAEAQFAPLYAMTFLDADGDGLKDLIVGGNQQYTRIKIGKMDANYGMLLRNTGKCTFKYVPQTQSGLSVRGDVRDILTIQQANRSLLLFGRNNDTVKSYILQRKK